MKMSNCTDSPEGWVDSDGDSCEWYAQPDACEDYGNGFANFGKTANEACCVCGGGTNSASFFSSRHLFHKMLDYFYPQVEDEKLDWQK